MKKRKKLVADLNAQKQNLLRSVNMRTVMANQRPAFSLKKLSRSSVLKSDKLNRKARDFVPCLFCLELSALENALHVIMQGDSIKVITQFRDVRDTKVGVLKKRTRRVYNDLSFPSSINLSAVFFVTNCWTPVPFAASSFLFQG